MVRSAYPGCEPFRIEIATTESCVSLAPSFKLGSQSTPSCCCVERISRPFKLILFCRYILKYDYPTSKLDFSISRSSKASLSLMETSWSLSWDTVDTGIIQIAWTVSRARVMSGHTPGSSHLWPHCTSPGPHCAPHNQSRGDTQPPVTLQ